MSPICQASHDILALHENDLQGLKIIPPENNLHETLIKHHIDIKLECKLTGNGPKNSNSKLNVVSWNHGSTNLCGTCSFCTMFADGMQQSVESDQWYGWNLSSKINSDTLSRPFKLRAIVHFEKSEYQKHCAPKTVDRQSVGYWEVNLLLTDGYVLLYPEDSDDSEEPGRIDVPLAFELFGEEDDPVVQVLGIHRRPFHGPRLSDDNVATMQYWIEDCDKNHEDCSPAVKRLCHNKARVYLPTRMIDVGDTTANTHPRLIITSELPARAPEDEVPKYIALSYCWGKLDAGSKLLKTTNDTIRSWTEKIEMTRMPRTFQDAINVARKLSIQYIWIDSLCIIQDNSRDWQIESSRMAEIFNNAYLTLIAATGSGCNDGFVDRGLPGLSCTVPLEIGQRQGQLSLRFRPHRGPYDKMTEMRSSRWVNRGWTFQEERLARRSLIFGERKFFFDCRSVERSQDTDRYLSRPDWVSSIIEGLSESGGDNTEANRRWNHWRTLCTHYSYRELTYAEDKLPAISGMANKIGKKVSSQYLAGLWKDNLMHDLFWETADSGTKPPEYRAPSWSWASLDGKIRWPLRCDLRECSTYCSILDAQTTLFGLDPYGAVKDGFIKVRGLVQEMGVSKVVRTDSRHDWSLCHEGQEIGHASLDIEEIDRVQDRSTVYHAILMVGCRKHGESNLTGRGLLLKKTGRSPDGSEKYERLGIFTLSPGTFPDQLENHYAWDRSTEEVIMII